MNKSAKNFGYGFSALALALSSVNLPAILGAAGVSAADCPAGSTTDSTVCIFTVNTAADFKAAAAHAAVEGKTITIKLGADIDTTAVEDGAVFSGAAKTLDLNGHALIGDIKVNEKKLTIDDTSAKKDGKIIADKAVVTVKVAASGDAEAEIKAGIFVGGAIVARDGSAIASGQKVAVKGGDFTGVANLTDGSDYAGQLINGITGGVFATSPASFTTKKVFTSGSFYVLADSATVVTTPSATTKVAKGTVGDITYTNAVVADATYNNYKVNNNVTYAITDKDDKAITGVSFEDVFVLGAATVASNKATIPVTVKEGAKAGSYKIVATSSDGVKGTSGVIVVSDAAEQMIGDFYAETASGDRAVEIDTKAVTDFATANSFTVAYESSNATLATVASDGKVTIKDGKSGTANVTVYFGTGSDAKATKVTEFTYGITVLDTAPIVEVADVTGDVSPIVLDTTALPAAWATSATISDKGDATFKANYGGGSHTWDQTYQSTTITPSKNVGVSSRTYTFNGAVVTENPTTHKFEVKNGSIEKKVSVYSAKVTKPEVALKLSSPLEEVNLNTAVAVPEGVTATFTNTASSAVTELVGDKVKAKSASSFGTDGYKATFTVTGTAATVDSTIKVSTYKADAVEMVASADAVVYGKLGTTAKTSSALTATGSDSTFKTSSKAATIVADGADKGKVAYTGTKNGSEVVTITETLGGKTLNTGTIEFRTFGFAFETGKTVYVKPGETITIPASEITDAYGTVGVTSDLEYKANADGSYTFTAGEKEGTYGIAIKDYLTNDDAIAANGGTGSIAYARSVVVTNDFVEASAKSFSLENGENTGTFTVKTSDKTIPTVSIVDKEGNVVADPGIVIDQVSFADGIATYKVTANSTVTTGQYGLKFSISKASATVELNLNQRYTGFVEGVYSIASAIDDQAVIDIPGQSKNDGASAQVYKANGTRAQQFAFTKDKDGFYTIRNLASGKVLEVADLTNGGDVQQNSINGKDNQKWAIYVNADGSYSFASKVNKNFVIDLPGRSTKNGTNVQVYKANGTIAQKFTVVADASFNSIDKVADINTTKSYKIRSTKNTDMVLDVAGRSKENGGNIQAYKGYDPEGGVNVAQTFTFEKVEGDLYIIHTNTNKDVDLVLDVANGGTSNGANVWQYKNNGTLAQKWAVFQVADGKYSFRSALSGLYLDLANNPFTVNNGSNLQTYTGNGTTAQIFTLEEVAQS